MNTILSGWVNKKATKDEYSHEEINKPNDNPPISVIRKGFEFCEAYGGVIAYYCSVLGAICAALVAPVFNNFEGGCKYPYLSEVARSGTGWFIFLSGSVLGGIPWIVFSFNYFRVFYQFSKQISYTPKRYAFIVMQCTTLGFNILSSLGMISTAFFDMGHFPLIHQFSVGFFAVPLNLLIINNYIDMVVYGKQRNAKYLFWKFLALLVSFGGIIAFTILGCINRCKWILMSMELCLEQTSEDLCFSSMNNSLDGYTLLRYYPRCQQMHFWRGFVEFIALLASAQNTMQSILINKCNTLPTNPFILKEVLEQKNENVKESSIVVLMLIMERFSKSELTKIIVCGVILSALLLYFFVCIICSLCGMNVFWPINWCLYVVFVTLFHLSEFVIAAVYRRDQLCFDSYLVNQSIQYEVAMVTGMVEFWIEYFFVPILRDSSISFWIGFILCFCGGLLRASGEIQLGHNFNHRIETTKSNDHVLITNGLYSIFRHPAYTGWFYFSIGTQVLLMNPLCTIAYAGAAWYFFYVRIPIEERYLLSFFPDYEEYRDKSHVFIPFIPKVQPSIVY